MNRIFKLKNNKRVFAQNLSLLPTPTNNVVRQFSILVGLVIYLLIPTHSNAQCPYLIQKVGEPSLCTQINNDPAYPLANLDCDGGGIDNITECLSGNDPTDPSDDAPPSCGLNYTMTYSFNDIGTCRFYADLNCDDTACPVTSWDYDISAGTVSITGISTSTLNAPTMQSFRSSVLGCGNTIRITRKDFVDKFPAGLGEEMHLQILDIKMLRLITKINIAEA